MKAVFAEPEVDFKKAINDALLQSVTKVIRDVAKETKLPTDVGLTWLGRLPRTSSLPAQGFGFRI